MANEIINIDSQVSPGELISHSTNPDKKISGLEVVTTPSDSSKIPICAEDSTNAISALNFATYVNEKNLDAFGKFPLDKIPNNALSTISIDSFVDNVEAENNLGYTTQDKPDSVVFDKSRCQFLFEYQGTYYKHWKDEDRYGVLLGNKVVPYIDKTYLVDKAGFNRFIRFQWNGETLDIVYPNIPSILLFDGIINSVNAHDLYGNPIYAFAENQESLSIADREYSVVFDISRNRFLLRGPRVNNKYQLFTSWREDIMYGMADDLGVFPHNFRTYYNIGAGGTLNRYYRWNGTTFDVSFPQESIVIPFAGEISSTDVITIEGECSNRHLGEYDSRIVWNSQYKAFHFEVPHLEEVYINWRGSEVYGKFVEGRGVIPYDFKIYKDLSLGEYRQYDDVLHILTEPQSVYSTAADLKNAIIFYSTKTFDDLFLSLLSYANSYQDPETPIGQIVYEAGEKIYRLNGLDMTYEEALAVVGDALRPKGSPDANGFYDCPMMGRTNIPFAKQPGTSYRLKSYYISGPNLEVYRVTVDNQLIENPSIWDAGIATAYIDGEADVFIDAPNLHTILGQICVRGSNPDIFYNCPKLKDLSIQIHYTLTDLELGALPAISFESISRLVELRNVFSSSTKLCSVYLNPNAFTRIFDGSAQAEQLLADAALKKISFAVTQNV